METHLEETKKNVRLVLRKHSDSRKRQEIVRKLQFVQGLPPQEGSDGSRIKCFLLIDDVGLSVRACIGGGMQCFLKHSVKRKTEIVQEENFDY